MQLKLKKAGHTVKLVLAAAGLAVGNTMAATYPAPQVAAPDGVGGFPSGFAAFAPPTNSTSPAAGAPEIAEWTRVNDPGDTMILTGEAFSRHTGVAEGRDTRFVFYGQPDTTGIAVDGLIQRLDDREVALTLPEQLPAKGMYLLWPENENGFGRPVAVNQTEAWWVGPDKTAPGATFSIYGRNLALGGGKCHAFIEELGRWLTSTSENPYKAEFTLPPDVAAGDYTIWAHNGHGRSFGWASALNLSVEADMNWSAGATINVKNHGAKGDGSADDRSAIQSAIDAAGWGDTVYFPEGVYLIGTRVKSFSGKRLLGAGMDKTTIRSHSNFASGGTTALIHIDRGGRFEIRDLTVHAGNYLGDKKIYHGRDVSDARIVNVRFSQLDTPNRQDVVDAASATRVQFIGCEFLTARNVFVGWSRQITFEDCHWYGIYDCNVLLSTYGADELSVTGCTAQHYEGTNQIESRGWCSGRFLWGSGHGGTHRNIYIGDNALNNLHPRYDPRYEKWEQELNTGEHVMFELTATLYDGMASAGSANTVTLKDSSGGMHGKILVITDGKGRGQSRMVVAFDSATRVATVDKPWRVVPDASSKLAAGHYVNQLAVYGNHFDGHERLMDPQPNSNRYATNVTATTAVSMYGAFQDLVIEANHIQQMRTGIFCWGFGYDEIQPDAMNNPQPNYFNLIQDNDIEQCHSGIYIKTATFNSYPRSPGKVIAYNVWRNNRLSNITHTAVVYESNLSEYTIGMCVFDHNTASDLGLKSIADSGNLENQVWVGNIFDGGGESTAIAFSDGHVPALSDNQWNNYQNPYGTTAPGAVLELPTRSVSLSSNVVSRQVNVVNGGTAPLNWTATVDKSWITLTGNSGTIDGERVAAPMTIEVDPAAIPEDDTAAIISVTGDGQTKQMMVEFAEFASEPPPPVDPPPVPILTGITINGPTFIDENATAQFYCVASYSDGSTASVSPSWSATAGATINGSGLLTAADVMTDQSITVTATFDGETATSSATIRQIAASLDRIEINGPLEVDEQSTTQYACVAFNTDGSSAEVTPTWSENGFAAGISSDGVLMTGDIGNDTSFSLAASYGGRSVSKSVIIKYLPPALTGLTIVGPLAVDEGTTAQYGCVGTFSDGGTEVVYPMWSENSSVTTLTSGGLLAAGDVAADQMIIVTASLDGVTTSQAVNIRYEAPYITGLTIGGSAAVLEETSSQYTCSANYSDGSATLITPSWSATGAASINSSGLLAATSVGADQTATITATHAGESDTFEVTIQYVAPSVTGIAIAGPGYIDEGLTASYDCVASYSDGTTKPVVPVWSLDSPYASVNAAGLLMANDVAADKNVRLYAAHGGFEVSYGVTVKYVAPSVTLTGLTITAPVAVEENTAVAVTCVANFSDGSTEAITPTWSVDASTASIDSNGLVDFGNVAADGKVSVTATYSGRSDTVEIDVWAVGTRAIYPLTGFDGKTIKARLWNEAAQSWYDLGEMDSPSELVVESVGTGQWYWVTLEEYNETSSDWDLVHANWISM